MSKEINIRQLADYKQHKDVFNAINPHEALRYSFFKRFYRNAENATSSVYAEYETEAGAEHKMTQNQAEAFAVLYLGTEIAKLQYGDAATVDKNAIFKFFSNTIESDNLGIIRDKFYRSLVSSMTSTRDRIRNLINSKDCGDILLLPETTEFEKDLDEKRVENFNKNLYDADPAIWSDCQWSSPFEQHIETIFEAHYEKETKEYVNIEELYNTLYLEYKKRIGTESFAKRASVAANAKDRLYGKTGWKIKGITIDLSQTWFDTNTIVISRALQPELWNSIDHLLKQCHRIYDALGYLNAGTVTSLASDMAADYKNTGHYRRGQAAFKKNFIRTFGETIEDIKVNVGKINALRIIFVSEAEYNESIRQLYEFYTQEF